MAHIANNRNVDTNIFVDGGRINIHVDLGRPRRKGVQATGHPVVKPRTDANHDIAIVHSQICFVGAVHTKHADELFVRRRKRSQPHERQGARCTGHLHELGQQLAGRRARIDDAATGVD